ncbi:MAG: elongation factor Ts [Acidimicrobiia bacterium]|nr:elongation factor Ts [Acidimicrobiia bacterium]
MAEFSAKDVQELRQATSVGMMDAKKALVASEGDFDKAVTYLREKGLAATAKRADRDASEGCIGSYLHNQAGRDVQGVLVYLSSETDFVAKSPEFVETARDIAMHIAWGKPDFLTREEIPAEDLRSEADIIANQAKNEGKPDTVIPKIVEGRLEKYYQDRVLLDQPFVKSDKFEGTVGELVQQLAAKMGENIAIKSFSRIAVGEN